MKHKITCEFIFDDLTNNVDPKRIIENINSMLETKFNILNIKGDIAPIGPSDVTKIGKALNSDVYISSDLLLDTDCFDVYVSKIDVEYITSNCIYDIVKIKDSLYYAAKAICDDEGFIYLSLLSNDQYPYRIWNYGHPLNIKDIK